MFIVDETCDGEPDFVILEPKRKRDPVLYMFDEDGDGKVELTLLDFDRDGAFDAAFYDTDGDGEADLRGDFRNGEDEPYRWEKLK
jgi:hypothetical protein